MGMCYGVLAGVSWANQAVKVERQATRNVGMNQSDCEGGALAVRKVSKTQKVWHHYFVGSEC